MKKKKKKKIVASFIHTIQFQFQFSFFAIMEITSIQWKSVGRWICIFYIRLRLQKLNVQTVYKFEGTSIDFMIFDRLSRAVINSQSFSNFIFFDTSFEKRQFDLKISISRIQTVCNLFYLNIYYSREDKKSSSKQRLDSTLRNLEASESIFYCDFYLSLILYTSEIKLEEKNYKINFERISNKCIFI